MTSKTKLKQFFIILLAVFLFATPAFAETPPYSQSFGNEQDMMDSLGAYIENFPDSHPHPWIFEQKMPMYHLKEQEVLLPKIINEDFALTLCSYLEASFDAGINYCSFNFEDGLKNHIDISFHYGLNSKDIQDIFIAIKDRGQNIREGVHNEMPYIAFTDTDDTNSYYLILDGILVNVIDYESFEEDRIDLISFETTELILPVFVKNDFDVSYEQDDKDILINFDYGDKTVKKLLGDMNNDDRITAADARIVLRLAAKLEKLSPEENILADANRDGNIQAADARKVLRVAAKLENLV